MDDPLLLAGRAFRSRLLLGTARFPDLAALQASIKTAEAEIATVAIRRIDLKRPLFHAASLTLLPNTAGCFTAREAILTAELAREALQTDWIKLEVIGDEATLLPDVAELLVAAEALVRKGFQVLPYCTDDLIVCKRLQNLGCAAVMPLASPIGSGLGIRNPHNLALLREAISLPLIVDAGIGTASDAALAMELGADALLVNSAIALAKRPVQMAEAMKLAVQAGRSAYLAGRIPKRFYASPSSPMDGRISCAP